MIFKCLINQTFQQSLFEFTNGFVSFNNVICNNMNFDSCRWFDY